MNTTEVRRTGVIVAALLLSATLVQAQGAQLLVTNVLAQQRTGTTLVDVEYDLETVGDLPVWVSLHLSTNSGTSYPILCRAVAGSVGGGVLPGTARRIVWNAGEDFPGDFGSPTCRLRVTAYDGENTEDFVYVSPGTFMMGSPTTELLRGFDETQHLVTLARGIYVEITEVTNQQYTELVQWAYDQGYVTATRDWLYDNMDGSTQLLLRLLDGECEITFSDGTFSVDAGKANYPVMYMTWFGAAAYCDWLSLQRGLTRAYNHGTWQCNRGNPYTAVGYRLPTEAEWEYACRAGTETAFNTGSCLGAGAEANYLGSAPYVGCPAGSYVGGTVPVGSYPANAFVLHDIHGNLWEWCNDWMGEYGGAASDPAGPGTGESRVCRGGGWRDQEMNCRSARRRADAPFNSYNTHGFRPVRSSNSVVPQPGTMTIGPEPDSINAP